MSLYERAIADGHQYERLEIIGKMLPRVTFPRFRDCWIERTETGLRIVVYTRTGGRNRLCNCIRQGLTHPQPLCLAAANERMRKSYLYLHDQDDPVDPTHALWYFAVPPGCWKQAESLAEPPRDMQALWATARGMAVRGELPRTNKDVLAERVANGRASPALLRSPTGRPPES